MGPPGSCSKTYEPPLLREMFVGTVGMENNSGRDFKDLRRLQRNGKSSERNDGERKGILNAPLKLPRFSQIFSLRRECVHSPDSDVGFWPNSHGTDGEPTPNFDEAIGAYMPNSSSAMVLGIGK